MEGTFRRGRAPAYILAVLACLVVSATVASVAAAAPRATSATIVNFDRSAPRPPGYPHGAQVVRVDTEGNALDAKADFIAHFGGSYYLYGESYDCTYMFFPSPGFCGFKAYKSPDLVHWDYQGRSVDPATSEFAKATCGGETGCWGPIVVYNQSTQKYVLWFYRAIGAPQASPLVVMEGDSPLGPWVNPSFPNVPTGFAQDIFVDRDGRAYLSWGSPSSGLQVQELNSTYTDAIGTPTAVTLPGGSLIEPKCQAPTGFGSDFENQTPAVLEAWKRCGLTESPSILRHGSRYYMTFSNPICAFCLGTETSYFIADNPLGPWQGVGGSPSNDPAQPGKFTGYTLSTDTCGGQPFHVAHLPTANGDQVDLFAAVLWENSRNEGSANHYWEPLRFRNGLLKPLRCGNVHVPLARKVPREEKPSRAINLAAVASGSSLTQTLEAPAGGLISAIELPLYQKTDPTRPFATEGLTSEPLTVRLSGPGGQTVKTVSPAEVSWSPTRVQFQTAVKVAKGDQLTLTLSSTTPQGRYATLFEDHDPYRHGRLTGSGIAASLVSPRSDILFRAVEQTARGQISFGG
jgi:Glycosyl hydrolases family 43